MRWNIPLSSKWTAAVPVIHRAEYLVEYLIHWWGCHNCLKTTDFQSGANCYPHIIHRSPATLTIVASLMERAQAAALPGHEAVERDSILRALHRLLQRERDRP